MTTTSPGTNELISLAANKISQARHPVSFSGAGLSAESGIATFRDKDESALWNQFNPAELASQEGFKSNPQMVTDWYNSRRKTAAMAEPNPAHRVLGAHSNWIHVTQNVDQLLESGGASVDKVLHLHGILSEDRCNTQCGHTEKVNMHSPAGLRRCPECGAYLRPSVVWFGEQLPKSTFDQAIRVTEQCDLLLVIGTSAQVMPAASMISIARNNGATIVIVNKEASPASSAQDIELIGNAGELVPLLFATQNASVHP